MPTPNPQPKAPVRPASVPICNPCVGKPPSKECLRGDDCPHHASCARCRGATDGRRILPHLVKR